MALFSTRNGILGSSLYSPRWFIGADATQGVYSDDNGSTWDSIVGTTLDRSPFFGLQNGVIMGGGFSPFGLYQSTDNGSEFTSRGDIFSGQPVVDFTGNIRGKWVAVGKSNKIAYSSTYANSFTLTTSPFSGSPSLTAVTNDKNNRFVVCGASHNPGAGNVYTLGYSTDGGINWTDSSVTGNTAGNTLYDIATDGVTWIAVGQGSSIYKSVDGGATWSDISGAVPFSGGVGDNIYSIAHFDGKWIISGVDSTVTNSVAISVSTNSGTSWGAFVTNSSSVSVQSRIRCGSDGVFMVTYKDNPIKTMISTDGGVTWGSSVSTGMVGAWDDEISFLGNNSGNT